MRDRTHSGNEEAFFNSSTIYNFFDMTDLDSLTEWRVLWMDPKRKELDGNIVENNSSSRYVLNGWNCTCSPSKRAGVCVIVHEELYINDKHRIFATYIHHKTKELGKDVLTSYDTPLIHPLLLCLNDPDVKRAHLPSNKRKKREISSWIIKETKMKITSFFYCTYVFKMFYQKEKNIFDITHPLEIWGQLL